MVVTARRVSENIQSTPVSVTAFTNTMLEQANITKTADLMLQTPGVFLSGSGGRENSVFQIRSQSKALSGFNSPAVVSYFADVSQPTFGSSIDLYDMASAQVLKGPQGTLFCRNTTGGAVLYYPATPGYDHKGYVEAGWGRYNDRQFEGAVDLPSSTARPPCAWPPNMTSATATPTTSASAASSTATTTAPSALRCASTRRHTSRT